MATSEQKQEAFLRLSAARLATVENEIRKIGNLSNRGNYVYSAAQVDSLFAKLEDCLLNIRNKFEANPRMQRGCPHDMGLSSETEIC